MIIITIIKSLANPGHLFLALLLKGDAYSREGAYRKIPKISPRAYIFQRPFLRGLFLEALIYGGKFAF